MLGSEVFPNSELFLDTQSVCVCVCVCIHMHGRVIKYEMPSGV